MKKFIIRDEDEREYEVEEVNEELDETSKDVTDDDNSLSAEDITALKMLAKSADKILALLSTEEKEHEAMADEDEDEEAVDEDELDEDETIVDTDEEIEETKSVLKTDSKKSFGSIAKQVKNKNIADAHQLDIDDAWSKRYNGGNN